MELQIYDISLHYIEPDGKPHFYKPVDISHYKVTELFGIHYINYWGFIRELIPLGHVPNAFFLDTVHPRQMAKYMEKVKEPYLRSKGIRWIDGSMQYA